MSNVNRLTENLKSIKSVILNEVKNLIFLASYKKRVLKCLSVKMSAVVCHCDETIPLSTCQINGCSPATNSFLVLKSDKIFIESSLRFWYEDFMDELFSKQVSELIERFERMFAAILAVYSRVKANHTMSIFHTDEESTLLTGCPTIQKIPRPLRERARVRGRSY